MPAWERRFRLSTEKRLVGVELIQRNAPHVRRHGPWVCPHRIAAGKRLAVLNTTHRSAGSRIQRSNRRRIRGRCVAESPRLSVSSRINRCDLPRISLLIRVGPDRVLRLIVAAPASVRRTSSRESNRQNHHEQAATVHHGASFQAFSRL